MNLVERRSITAILTRDLSEIWARSSIYQHSRHLFEIDRFDGVFELGGDELVYLNSSPFLS
jgi:hypothetical protein